jgi:hypothetical protein
MNDDVAFRNALEAVSHIGDPAPPWHDVLTSAKDLIGADAATLLMFDPDQELILLQQTGIDPAAEQECFAILQRRCNCTRGSNKS